jgi:5,10-methylenetetrahydromethanopterin reductase
MEHDLADPVDDLGIYIVCGRVQVREEPGYTHIGRALDDAVEAERLGFRRTWLSERFDLKDHGAILAGAAARTTRLGVGTGALAAGSRHPVVTASFGATMRALYGPRFVLGLGRGVPLPDMPEYKIAELLAYARTVKGLWAGETQRWGAPGREPVELRAVDALDGIDPPEIWYCTYGGPKAAVACADPSSTA